MKYGDLPIEIDQFKVDCKEMMFYQYLPIKLAYGFEIKYEYRLNCFNEIIDASIFNFIQEFGRDNFEPYYVYLTAKYLYQSNGCSFNREGYHSDGFMTDDINYLWSDKLPTVFNYTEFELTQNDSISMSEMQEQALYFNVKTYPENTLLRLNQFNIHKVAPQQQGWRTFVKISFSKDKYDLIGNSHNYLLDYNWQMNERKTERNIPQSIIKL